MQYCRICREHFRSESGAFYLTPDDGEALLVRTRPFFDAPAPSGNAVMMMNLLRLGHLTSDAALIHEAWGVRRGARSAHELYACQCHGHAVRLWTMRSVLPRKWSLREGQRRGIRKLCCGRFEASTYPMPWCSYARRQVIVRRTMPRG